MDSGKIRLFATVLAVSTLTLMASASEVQALERHWAFCGSGRCVRATGTYMVLDGGRPIMSSPCILMLDLVRGYIAGDHPNLPGPGGGWLPVHIEYGRFSIHAYSTDTMMLEFHFYIGIPGGAILRAYPPGGPQELLFLGLGSFYYRMEYVPWY